MAPVQVDNLSGYANIRARVQEGRNSARSSEENLLQKAKAQMPRDTEGGTVPGSPLSTLLKRSNAQSAARSI